MLLLPSPSPSAESSSELAASWERKSHCLEEEKVELSWEHQGTRAAGAGLCGEAVRLLF